MFSQGSSAGGWSVVMSDDRLSNGECTSPDDISLPPLAETPESNVVQSDVEEGFHTNHQTQNLAGTGAAHRGSAPLTRSDRA